MPHKRAKKSVRESDRKDKGFDLVPANQSLSNEAIPKSISRVLNASKIRESWKQKRKSDNEDDRPESKRRKTDHQPRIRPGESVQHFNKRVEQAMRPLVKEAAQASKVVSRQTIREEKLSKPSSKHAKPSSNPSSRKTRVEYHSNEGEDVSLGPGKHANKPTEFQTTSTSTPRRLNDIAQAPPELKKLPRGADKVSKVQKKQSVLSMAQKVMMDEEREKAIAGYRELKARRQAEVS